MASSGPVLRDLCLSCVMERKAWWQGGNPAQALSAANADMQDIEDAGQFGLVGGYCWSKACFLLHCDANFIMFTPYPLGMFASKRPMDPGDGSTSHAVGC